MIAIFLDNTSPSIEDTIRVDGDPFDLTGCTVKLQMRDESSGTLKINAPATIVDDASGAVRYDWQSADTDTVGEFQAWWRVTLPSTAIQDTGEFTVRVAAHALGEPRDLCTLADVTSYVPGYTPNDITDAKLQQLLSAESDLIHDEAGREIVAKGTQPATRQFEISIKATQLREIGIGDLVSTEGLTVSILNWDGTVSRTVDLDAIIPLYEGERQPTRDWEPITSLYFPWGRADMPVFLPLQALELTGTFGFPQVPSFVREACAKRVIIRYISDVAHLGTDFANAVEAGNLNLAAMFDAAQDAIAQLSGRVVLA